MNKFKVGDKVVRTGKDYKDIKKSGIYVVSEVSKNANKWSCAINLEEHYNKNGEFDYDGNSFELYEEEDMEGRAILTPLQAAEAMLKDKDVEFLSNFCGEWIQVGRPYSKQCLTRLSEYKLRLKGSKILINEIPVPAPLSNKPKEGVLYYPNISTRNVTATNAGNDFIKLFWATKEDAQEVLDAMLIPFNNLEKG